MHLPKCTILKFLAVRHIETQTNPIYDGASKTILSINGTVIIIIISSFKEDNILSNTITYLTYGPL